MGVTSDYLIKKTNWNYSKNRSATLKFIKENYPLIWQYHIPSSDYYFAENSDYEVLPELIFVFPENKNSEGIVHTKLNNDQEFEVFFNNLIYTELRQNNFESLMKNDCDVLRCPLLTSSYVNCEDCMRFTHGNGKRMTKKFSDEIKKELCSYKTL